MKRNILRLGCSIVGVVFVVGVFLFIYQALAPKPGGTGLASPTSGAGAPSIDDTLLGWYLQFRQADLAAASDSDESPVPFSVVQGDLPANVAKRLQSQGLVRDSDLFLNLTKYRHAGSNIQAGDYVLKRTMTMDEILEALQHGRARAISIIIRPGWRAEEIGEYLETLGLSSINKAQFLQAVKNSRYDFAFLKDRPPTATTSLEGFVFPETYSVPYDVSVDTLINLILSTFDQRVTDKMRQQATSARMTLYEVVTLASIVEREAVVASERPVIASVYLNRLKKKQLLQADPTVQYAMGYQPSSKQWWKTPVTLEEYQRVVSPYNTYLNPGLTPGPICNPSMASIVAVLEPAQTDYYFFLAKGDGSHVFARTFEEHQQNMIKYGYTK